MMAVQINRTAGNISDGEWDFYVRGSGGLVDVSKFPPKPASFISDVTWGELCAMTRVFNAGDLIHHLCEHSCVSLLAVFLLSWHVFSLSHLPTVEEWKHFWEDDRPYVLPLPEPFSTTFTLWQRFMFVRVVREEKLLFSNKEYVASLCFGDEVLTVPHHRQSS